jgi:hypothetical protein
MSISASVYESVIDAEGSSKVVKYSMHCATIDSQRLLHWWTVTKRYRVAPRRCLRVDVPTSSVPSTRPLCCPCALSSEHWSSPPTTVHSHHIPA